jgi:hypothetical protein
MFMPGEVQRCELAIGVQRLRRGAADEAPEFFTSQIIVNPRACREISCEEEHRQRSQRPEHAFFPNAALALALESRGGHLAASLHRAATARKRARLRC